MLVRCLSGHLASLKDKTDSRKVVQLVVSVSEMLLTLDVDVIAIAVVGAFGAGMDVDEAVDDLALAEDLADVPSGLFHGDGGHDDDLDVEILRVGDLYGLVVHKHRFMGQKYEKSLALW